MVSVKLSQNQEVCIEYCSRLCNVAIGLKHDQVVIDIMHLFYLNSLHHYFKDVIHGLKEGNEGQKSLFHSNLTPLW